MVVKSVEDSLEPPRHKVVFIVSSQNKGAIAFSTKPILTLAARYASEDSLCLSGKVGFKATPDRDFHQSVVARIQCGRSKVERPRALVSFTK